MTPLETQELALATRTRIGAMEKWTADRERMLLVDGGIVDNASDGRTVVRWAMRVPNMCELERLGDELAHRVDTLEKLRTIKTRKRARARVNHERARAEYERSGADAITGYSTDAKKRPVALRIFYRSFGDEILACESEPMTCADAERTKGAEWDRFGWAMHVEIVPATPRSMSAIREVPLPSSMREAMAGASDVKPWREAIKSIPTHARFVVFPSQRPERVESHDETRTDNRPPAMGLDAGLLL